MDPVSPPPYEALEPKGDLSLCSSGQLKLIYGQSFLSKVKYLFSNYFNVVIYFVNLEPYNFLELYNSFKIISKLIEQVSLVET